MQPGFKLPSSIAPIAILLSFSACKGNETIESLTYTIKDENDNLKLFGGFPNERTEKYTNHQVLNIPSLIIELLEKESVCRHK